MKMERVKKRVEQVIAQIAKRSASVEDISPKNQSKSNHCGSFEN